MPPFDEYIDETRDLWETHWLTNIGTKHQAFVAALEEYLGVSHLDLLANGHMALEMTLQVMNLHGEVVTTPFTFASMTRGQRRRAKTECRMNQ